MTAGIVFSLDIHYWSTNGFETTLLAVLQMAFLLSLRAATEPTSGSGGVRGLSEPAVNGDPSIQVVVGVMLRQQALPDRSVAVIPAGIVSYLNHLRAIDLMGKSDRYIAHLPCVQGGRAAHGEYDPEYSFGPNRDLFVSRTRCVDAARAREALAECEKSVCPGSVGGTLTLGHQSASWRTRS